MFQSTHPRGVRQGVGLIFVVGLHVSIHAPARGATCKGLSFTQTKSVSIHAPARGATRKRVCIRDHINVSIHAPARGATPTWRRICKSLLRFNPRTREGCDCNASASPRTQLRFQSTHPRGVRRQSWFSWPCAKGFQSTHPRGVRRKSFGKGIESINRFNPRTREGCDKKAARFFDYSRAFQSTHPRGVRHWMGSKDYLR